jgi:hypothetical protein
MKKVMGLVIIGVVFTAMLPIGCAQNPQTQPADEYVKFFGVGFIRIDSFNHEISGYVIYGNNNGETIVATHISLKYNGSPILVGGLPPLFVRVKYIPAETN